MSLLQEFRENWVKFKTPAGASMLLAVSGGADSMVMADLFLKSNLPFAVAHCNFGLRGEEADLDEKLVHDWCAANTIQFHSVKFETKEKSQEWKKGTQETARILRYEWFEQVRDKHGYAGIATAHHANDNVETLLVNLFKGTGIAGLHGIRPVNGNIVRPLLFATRQQLRAYAEEHKVQFREDASNASDDYLRNAVRNNIVPVVQQWFPEAVTSVQDSIARFREAEMLYRKAIEAERKKLVEQRGQDYYIPIRKLKHRQPLATICYELLSPFGFSSAQVPHVINLMVAESGHYISSPTHRVIKNRDFLVITTLPAETADFIVVDGVPATIDTGKFRYNFSIENKPKVIPADANIGCFNLEGIEFPLILRRWRVGDYFYPFGMKMKKKKVSRLLIDEKVPLHEKEDIHVLECNKRIAWVAGIRPDERFRVNDDTGKVLIVKRVAR